MDHPVASTCKGVEIAQLGLDNDYVSVFDAIPKIRSQLPISVKEVLIPTGRARQADAVLHEVGSTVATGLLADEVIRLAGLIEARSIEAASEAWRRMAADLAAMSNRYGE